MATQSDARRRDKRKIATVLRSFSKIVCGVYEQAVRFVKVLNLHTEVRARLEVQRSL